ncbi:hypothetical protein L6452_17714 [Arctium lappa]|uniref:Uncharacterized protein n=1 Tax=Arctium lappa TaxID=4217 RepID=A0ACB9C465_ARCLA|nr:hypothetical protein L6452_17714 [Arctium lappa]
MVNGKNVNVLQGLKLHTRVFNAEEQKKIVESMYEFQLMGQRGRLREKTYSEPAKSVLILKGNGADVAKHCVPYVPAKRISITFRRMDESKIPYGYSPDPELQGLQPMISNPSRNAPLQHNQIVTKEPSSRVAAPPPRVVLKPIGGSSFVIGENNFPPLGVRNASQQRGYKKNGFRNQQRGHKKDGFQNQERGHKKNGFKS